MRALVAVVLAGCGRIGFEGVPGDGPAEDAGRDAPFVDATTEIALLSHTIINGDVTAGLTTPAIDTVGATLLVLAACSWASGPPVLPTDSAGNTWVGPTGYGKNEMPANIRLFYVDDPKTAAVHTFTQPGNDDLSVAVIAFTGAHHFSEEIGGVGTSPTGPGAVGDDLVTTFACSGESIATAVDIQTNYTLVDTKLNGDASAPEDMASAFRTNVSATAPLWTFTGDNLIAVIVATFSR